MCSARPRTRAANGGVKIIPDGNPVKSVPLVARASVPVAEVVTVDQLKPVAGFIAFKHIHSGTVPTDPAFPFVPVNNTSDSRESEIYPVGLCVTPAAPNGLQCGSGNSTLVAPVAGQMNLTTTGFGNIREVQADLSAYSTSLSSATETTSLLFGTTRPDR